MFGLYHHLPYSNEPGMPLKNQSNKKSNTVSKY